MGRGLDAGEERRQQQRPVEAGVAAAAAAPGLELAVAPGGDQRRPHCRPALDVRVEERGATTRVAESRRRRDGQPPRRARRAPAALPARQARRSSRDPACRGPRLRAFSASIRGATSMSSSRACAADLREPEPVLLDEIEREPVGARWPRSGDLELQLDLLARGDGMWEARVRGPSQTIGLPSRSSQWNDACTPVGRRANARSPSRHSRARCARRHGRAGARRVERPGQPAGCERPGRDGMLADAVHDGGYSSAVSEPLLVRAARREEVERTPVWFMRQAGRSLPEYRAIREQHAFFDVAHTPELCAEVTLQPVRRHDVDAAVMFADIMTPVLGMGIDVRLVEGVGPVIDEPIRTHGRRRAPARPRPRGGVRARARGGAARPRGAAARSGSRRLLRRPVHGRRAISSRGSRAASSRSRRA